MFRFLLSVIFFSLTSFAWGQAQEVHLDDLMSPDEILSELEGSEASFDFSQDAKPLNFELFNRTQSRSTEWNALLPEESFQRFGVNWIQEFDLVLVINKAVSGPTAQRALVYYRGEYAATYLVSTGREKNEKAKSGKRYFSSTPTGWFSPTFLSRNHVSSLWGARMPFAVFFNGGIATHAALPAYYKDLGTRASGGCVRFSTEEAQWVFDRVQGAGKGLVPQFNRRGEPVMDRNGQIKYAQNWRTLIIVVNREGQ